MDISIFSFEIPYFYVKMSFSVKTALVNKVKQVEFPAWKAPWWQVPGKCTGKVSGC